MSDRSLKSFVRQFPVNLRDEVIKLLAEVEVLARGRIWKGIGSIIQRIASQTETKLVVCRFSPNSGNYAGMLFEADSRDDLVARGHIFTSSVSVAMEKIHALMKVGMSPHLVFVDDQFATGGQARAQLLHWAGKPREEWPIELRAEQNIDLNPSPPSFQKFLSDGRVVLAFVYGTDEGRVLILEQAKTLGFKNVQVEFGDLLPSKTSKISFELRSFFESVGVQVLNHCRNSGRTPTGDAQATLERDALGYGGRASLVITPYNVPSHALTAIWCPGVFDKQPWVPLVLRRGYRKHLVIG